MVSMYEVFESVNQIPMQHIKMNYRFHNIGFAANNNKSKIHSPNLGRAFSDKILENNKDCRTCSNAILDLD
jgi:hypothetical protein